jgi:hypothetical protein
MGNGDPPVASFFAAHSFAMTSRSMAKHLLCWCIPLWHHFARPGASPSPEASAHPWMSVGECVGSFHRRAHWIGSPVRSARASKTRTNYGDYVASTRTYFVCLSVCPASILCVGDSTSDTESCGHDLSQHIRCVFVACRHIYAGTVETALSLARGESYFINGYLGPRLVNDLQSVEAGLGCPGY